VSPWLPPGKGRVCIRRVSWPARECVTVLEHCYTLSTLRSQHGQRRQPRSSPRSSPLARA
jgi:hypothetical protein